MGPEGQVVPRQWLAHTTTPGVQPQDRRRLDLVAYGATTHGIALCCDAILVSPPTRTGHPQPCSIEVDGAALQVAEIRKEAAYIELTRGGPQKLLVLGSDIGGRWNTGARRFVRDLVRLRAQRAPAAARGAAASAWARPWWSILSVTVQLAVTSSARNDGHRVTPRCPVRSIAVSMG